MAIRETIVDGTLRGGELLSEVEVASRFGVSRTPVHDAFTRLETEGWLRIEPRRGVVVVPVDLADARDILEIRHALETSAARRIANTALTSEAVRAALGVELSDNLAAQAAAAEQGDVVSFAVIDEAFHAAIVRASGNRRSSQFYSTLADWQRRMAASSVGAHPEQLPGLVDGHRRLASMVTSGDASAFEAELLEHFARTHSVLLGATWSDAGSHTPGTDS